MSSYSHASRVAPSRPESSDDKPTFFLPPPRGQSARDMEDIRRRPRSSIMMIAQSPQRTRRRQKSAREVGTARSDRPLTGWHHSVPPTPTTRPFRDIRRSRQSACIINATQPIPAVVSSPMPDLIQSLQRSGDNPALSAAGRPMFPDANVTDPRSIHFSTTLSQMRCKILDS
jgi:hypothetical protein